MSTSPQRAHPSGGRLRRSARNLLLLVPLFTLVTPIFNYDQPRLGGMPFFYWFQFVGVPVGVLCTVVVYRASRGPAAGTAAGPRDVDELDERSRR